MNYKFQEYDFKYYFRPGKDQSKEQNLSLLNDLRQFNEENHKFKYGIFDPNINDEKIIKLFDDFIICVISIDGKIAGFFYFMILNEQYKRPLIQLGLVVIAKNKGYDIFSISEKIGLIYTYKKMGYYNSAIITTIPKIVEEFSKTYSCTWPNPFQDLSRAPLEYKEYLNDVSVKYVQVFFPQPYTINKRRYTLILDKREAGFHDRFHYLPMAKSFTFNAFCHGWINYDENEDLILIGKYDSKALMRTRYFLYKILIKLFFLNLLSKIVSKNRRAV